MQNLLTNLLEVLVIYHVVMLALSCTVYVSQRLNQSTVEIGNNFDSGVKEVMTVKVEETIPTKILPTTPVTPTVSPSVFANIASMRSYIKADVERQQKIEAFLFFNNCDRRKRADLAKAIKAVG